MNRYDELAQDANMQCRGPAFSAWPGRGMGRACPIRPHKGGGGDGGAREMENERQARVTAAINKINAIFNGQDQTVPTGQVSTYTPGQTYYNADGSVFVAPTKTEQVTVPTAQAGAWRGGGDPGASFQLNPGVQAKTSGGDADMLQGYYKNEVVPDQAAIDAALKNGLYTSSKTIKGLDRSALYGDQRQAVTDLNADDVNRQYTDAERANRFGLARAGLIGGSEDIDSNAELERRTNQGLIKAGSLGDQAAADLQAADERTRQNLISMAQSGIDTGQAGQLAEQQLDANASNAASARGGATIGNLFGDLANAYLYGQTQAGLKAGASPYQNYFQPGVSNSARSSYSGSTQG